MELALPWEKPFQHLRPHGVIIGVKGKELWSGRLGPFGLLASRKKPPREATKAVALLKIFPKTVHWNLK